MNNEVPVIDISGWFGNDEAARDRVAAAFGQACEEWGFLVISGHGIDPELIEQIRATTKEFFDLPVEQKLRNAAAGRKGGRGYYPMLAKSLARTMGDANAPGDLRESFRSGVESFSDDQANLKKSEHVAPNPWPDTPVEFKRLWTRYFDDCNRLSVEMMRICARALKLPDDWFDDKMDRSIGNVTAQHYPKLETVPEPGQIRSGAHTDFGTLTLLMTEDKPGGLEVRGLDGEWHPVKPLPGTYIVNLGDMMAQWTNDKWRSTLHRVVNPPVHAGESTRRLSMVFFHMPNDDALIECIPSCTDESNPPRYSPIRAGEHLAEKLRRVESLGVV